MSPDTRHLSRAELAAEIDTKAVGFEREMRKIDGVPQLPAHAVHPKDRQTDSQPRSFDCSSLLLLLFLEVGLWS